jgi:hypothetical protein
MSNPKLKIEIAIVRRSDIALYNKTNRVISRAIKGKRYNYKI